MVIRRVRLCYIMPSDLVGVLVYVPVHLPGGVLLPPAQDQRGVGLGLGDGQPLEQVSDRLVLPPPCVPPQLLAQPGDGLDGLRVPAAQRGDDQREEVDALGPAGVEGLGHLGVEAVLQGGARLLRRLPHPGLLQGRDDRDV